ncbi:hypothetical protein IMCC26207_109494 [Actinobacteria bacterium IMCC26207]|nr:hypothetical protein IMCC26207_109494 [Actinobacteria bacterium IMCC26207]
MRQARTPIRIIAALSISAVLAAVGVVATGSSVSAHGSSMAPASRIYSCRFLTPDNELCKQAWAANTQALYDWNGIRIGTAASQHESIIPDGKLCSAGNEQYATFDTASDKWPVTNLTPTSDGKYELKWENSAPHATLYYRVYITKPGFDVKAAPLKWSDLELVHQSGQTAAEASTVLRMNLPDRATHSMIYMIWQRSDSPEAFYSCSDVTVNASGQPTPTSTTVPPTTVPSGPTTVPPTTVPSGPTTTVPGAGVQLTLTKTDEWGSGRNFAATVKNATGAAASAWTVTLPWTSPVEPWDASATAADGKVSFSNVAWNASIASGGSRAFGFTDRGLGFTDLGYATPNPSTCSATLSGVAVSCSIVASSTPTTTTTTTTTPPTTTTAAPTPTTTTTPTTPVTVNRTIKVTSDWGTGYCADVTVSTTSQTAVTWTVKVPITKGKVTSVWEANYKIEGTTLTAQGTPLNAVVRAGAPKTFGFCAG